MTRLSVYDYVSSPEILTQVTRELFRMVLSGKIKIEINQTYALKDAARCHQDLEGRKTTGSCVLIP